MFTILLIVYNVDVDVTIVHYQVVTVTEQYFVAVVEITRRFRIQIKINAFTKLRRFVEIRRLVVPVTLFMVRMIFHIVFRYLLQFAEQIVYHTTIVDWFFCSRSVSEQTSIEVLFRYLFIIEIEYFFAIEMIHTNEIIFNHWTFLVCIE